MSDRGKNTPSSRSPTRLLREKSTAVTHALVQATGDATILARRTARSLSGAGGELWDSLWSRTQETTESLWRASKDAIGALLPEKRVRAFLLPTGRGRADFLCILDFREIVEQLTGGFFARPRLEIWTAREDVDRLALSVQLRTEFMAQLNKERQRRVEQAQADFSPVLARLDADKNRAGSLVEKATFAFTSSLLLMFFVANPIFNVIFLVLAVFSGAGGVTKALQYLRLAGRLRSSEKGLEVQQKNIEADLDAKSGDFRDAVGNLEITVHPVLERILVHISEMDGEPFIASGQQHERDALPRVEEFLRRPEYREALPKLYHPLVDAELG